MARRRQSQRRTKNRGLAGSAKRVPTYRRPRRDSRASKPHATNELTKRQSEARQRALRALRRMRQGASMSAATRAEHIKPSTFRRYVGRAIRRDTPGGRFHPAGRDKLVRLLQTIGPDGERVRAKVPNLAAARGLSAYENAVAHWSRTGDASRLRPFEGKTVVTEDGQRITLVTDPDRLQMLADAGLLQLDSLYASFASEP